MKTILVIEDQGQNQYLMKYLLESRGYRAILAGDGREGIEAARRKQPDLILLDIQLPTISGYEVARIIREDPALAGISIVAVTSYAMPGDREDALAAGCTGYIEKPIDPDTFVNEMEEHMPKDSGAARPPRTRGEGGDG